MPFMKSRIFLIFSKIPFSLCGLSNHQSKDAATTAALLSPYTWCFHADTATVLPAMLISWRTLGRITGLSLLQKQAPSYEHFGAWLLLFMILEIGTNSTPFILLTSKQVNITSAILGKSKNKQYLSSFLCWQLPVTSPKNILKGKQCINPTVKWPTLLYCIVFLRQCTQTC